MDLSASGLFANLAVSGIGFGFFLYGKQQKRVPPLVTGVLLMVFPYFVEGAWLMFGIAACIIATLWIATRKGY